MTEIDKSDGSAIRTLAGKLLQHYLATGKLPSGPKANSSQCTRQLRAEAIRLLQQNGYIGLADAAWV